MKTKKKITIKNCNCRFTKTGKFVRCKFHKQCVGVPCASDINICDNPDHLTKTEHEMDKIKLQKTWGQLKLIKMKPTDFFTIDSSFSNNHKAIKPICRFCSGETRALNSNGIIGGDYREWNYACKACGKVQ